MLGASGLARSGTPPGPIRLRDRSFVLAVGLPKEVQRTLERAIESHGGTIHPFLSSVTDVLVVGHVEGKSAEALMASERIRRGAVYRDRWGHLEIITEEELRRALDADREP